MSDTLIAPEAPPATAPSPNAGVPPSATPAPEISPSALGHINPDGTFKPSFNEYLTKRGLEKHAGSFAKYKTLDDALNGAAHAWSLVGKKSEGIQIPGEGATPEEQAAFTAAVNKARGVPESAEGYQIQKPAELPPGIEWDEGAVSEYLAAFHELGLPPAGVQKLIAKDIEIKAKQVAQREQQAVAAKEAAMKQLREVFGADYDLQMKGVRIALGELQARYPWVNENDPAFASPLGVIMAAQLGLKAAQDGRATDPTQSGAQMTIFELNAEMLRVANEMRAKQDTAEFPVLREKYNQLTAKLVAAKRAG